MNIENKVNNLLSLIKETQELEAYNYNVVLDISEPLLFILRQLDDYYLAYIMQNRTVKYHGKTTDIEEVLFVDTDMEEIRDLLNAKKSIKNVLYKKNRSSRIGRIGPKLYPQKVVEDIKSIENKIPREYVYLDEKLPNKVNVNKVLKHLEANHDLFDGYGLTRAAEKTTQFDMKNVFTGGTEHHRYSIKYLNVVKEYSDKKGQNKDVGEGIVNGFSH